MKVGLSEPVNTALAIWMAEAAGLYAAQGLDVSIADMNGGSRGAAELAAGRIDAMHVGLSSVVNLNATGADLRAIAVLANVIRFTLFARPGIRSAADLKGRTVGISTFGSESDTLVTFLLRRIGLTRVDVMLKEYGGGVRRLAALQSGEVAATALNEPMATLAREQGVPVLADLVPERIPWLFTAIVVRRDALASRRSELTRFLKATMDGNSMALADPERAKAVLAARASIRDPRIVDLAYADFRGLSPPDLMPTEEGARNIMLQLPHASGSVSDYVDTGILEMLLGRAR